MVGGKQRAMHRALIVGALAVLISEPLRAATLRVSTSGDDSSNGMTWETAKRTVQEAIDAAAFGDQVWVAAGVYVENVILASGVHVYGGFAGSESDLNQRNWTVNRTVLDGDQVGSVVTVPAGLVAGTRIDGFAIRNGSGNLSGSYRYGGGIDCRSTSTIANNRIVGNDATYGGGLYCTTASAVIMNNAIVGNTASGGGGLYSASPSVIIANNTVVGNSAHNGGGLYSSGTSPVIANNSVSGNVANSGGAIYSSSPSATIVNTLVTFNSSGVYKNGGVLTLRHNCVFANPSYNYSGLTDPTGTSGNISVDPLLTDPAYGKVHIQPTSACVEAGDNTAVPIGWLDMDGQARIIGQHVDIGADESDGTVWPAGPHLVVRVAPDGDDAADGLSWGSAKRTVQGGIDAAALEGGQVWVKAGTYLERVTLPPLVHLYGGFSGLESELEQRDWDAHVTTLDGSQEDGTLVKIPGGHAVNRIDGFTICNAYGGNGGGISCLRSSPTIANNTIVANVAGEGGGIYCSGYGLPLILNNTISSNFASDGGGIYSYYATPTISRNTICGNSAEYGGGIDSVVFSPTISNNVIAGNAASESGGGISCGFFSGTMANNTIVGNVAGREGGGITCGLSGGLISNCTVVGNSATFDGGAVCSLGSATTIANTIVSSNSSGIYAMEGMPVLRYNCVHGNTAYNYRGPHDPTGTDGNISADPGIVDAFYGNLHIQPDSPCRDAGDDTVVQADWVDMDGQSRVMDDHVDIGADESDGTIWPPGPSVIVRVSPMGDDVNDGSSWSQAKRTVQAGIDAASARWGEVWVQAGTYLGPLAIQHSVHIYGGFAGTEAQRDQRDWVAHPTILEGEEWSPAVRFQTGQQHSTLDGFVVRNGGPFDGGVYIYYSSPTIANCTITDNIGSGISCIGSSARIANCRIIGNGGGGGIHCSASTPTIINCTIAGNSADYGGGVYCSWLAPVIVNCTITGNSARSGGGVYCERSSAKITNTIVAFNSSGICVKTSGSPVLESNCVYGNTSYDYMGVTDPTGTAGNIAADPGIIRLPDAGADGIWGTEDDDHGDLRLLPVSPCLDAGDNSAVPADIADLDDDGDTGEPIPYDLDGQPRFEDAWTADTGYGTPPIVDMGACELPAGLYLLGAVSRKMHPAAFDIDLDPLSPIGSVGVECRASAPLIVALSFSAPADETSLETSTGNIDSVMVNGNEVMVELSGVPDASCTTLTVGGPVDLHGVADVHLCCLIGDVTGDGAVNIFDLIAGRNNLNQPVSSDNFRADVMVSGTINIFDLIAIRNNLNRTVVPNLPAQR